MPNWHFKQPVTGGDRFGSKSQIVTLNRKGGRNLRPLMAEGNLSENISLIPMERVERAILFIRGEKVMLDIDLATIYGVETKVLNQAVKRNVTRFPSDFMFQLSETEK
jgi:ORF6N domain